MDFAIYCLCLFFVELKHFLRLPDSFLVADHLLNLGLLLKVFAVVYFILNYLILLEESFVLLTHRLGLLSLGSHLGMGTS